MNPEEQEEGPFKPEIQVRLKDEHAITNLKAQMVARNQNKTKVCTDVLTDALRALSKDPPTWRGRVIVIAAALGTLSVGFLGGVVCSRPARSAAESKTAAIASQTPSATLPIVPSTASIPYDEFVALTRREAAKTDRQFTDAARVMETTWLKAVATDKRVAALEAENTQLSTTIETIQNDLKALRGQPMTVPAVPKM